MLSKSALPLLRRLGRPFRQFPNVELVKKQQEIQELYDRNEVIGHIAAYKPSYTLEFDRNGELLIYSAEPLRSRAFLLKYPYILYESMALTALWAFLVNPFALYFGWNYLFLGAGLLLLMPRAALLHARQYRIRRMYLLRGGRYVRFERATAGGDQLVNWAEVREFHPLTEDYRHFADAENCEFLDAEGQLRHDLCLECEHFKQFSVNEQNVPIFLEKAGVVHHPEVFDAVCRGMHVDTSDFAINTAHNSRAREPHYSL